MSVLLNGVSQVDLGLVLVEGSPAVAGFTRTRESISWPGRTGSIASPVATTPMRVLRFVYQARASMTATERNTALQRLSALLTGPIEVQCTDGTARRLVGVCTSYDASITTPSFVNMAPTVTVEITCPNAAFEDLELQQFALSATPTRMPVGTAGHTACFVLVGANTTPFTITYRNCAGTSVGQIACTPALAANETLVIDTATEQFVKYNTTAGTDGVLVPTWDTTPIDPGWPEFLPRDAQRELGAYATLEASTALGVYYRRNWEN